MMKKELQFIIGQNLRRIRKERNMTREDIAESIGISVTFYSNLESGNRMMSIVTLSKLSEVLGVSTDSLLKSNSPDNHIKNIEAILNGQPQKTIELVEKIALICSTALAEQPSENLHSSSEKAHKCCV